jgi:sulfur transfer complex TusBCD TusB component (DsrH family)
MKPTQSSEALRPDQRGVPRLQGASAVPGSKQPVVVLLQSGPGAQAAAALSLAGTMQRAGRPLTLVLLQDATLCAVSTNGLLPARRLRELVSGGAAVQVLDEDLAMRGFGRDALAPGCRPVDYGELVDTLVADGQNVAGAF